MDLRSSLDFKRKVQVLQFNIKYKIDKFTLVKFTNDSKLYCKKVIF